MLDLPITSIDFIWAYSIACQTHGVQLVTNTVLRKYRPPYSLGSITALAAEQSGLNICQSVVPYGRLASLPLPCLATLLPETDVGGSEPADRDDPGNPQRTYRLVLLQRVDDRYFYFVEARRSDSTTLRREDFRRRFAGEVLLFRAAMEEPHAAGGHDQMMSESFAAALRSATSRGAMWFRGLRARVRPANLH